MRAKKSSAKKAEKGLPPNWHRPLPSPKKRTRKYYSSSIISEASFFGDLDAELLRITFEVKTVDARHAPTGEIEAEKSETVTRESTLPLGLFKDEAQCKEWCNEVVRIYHETLSDALRGEAGIHFDLVTNMVLNDLGIVKVDLPGVIDGLAAMRAKGAKLSMHLPLKGRYSQWTPGELTLAIHAAVRSMPEHEKRDYENIAAKLQKSHPDKAPKTGDALRKLISRLDLKWKELKSGQ